MAPARPASPERKTIRNNVDVVQSIYETGSKLYDSAKEYYNKHFIYSLTISERDSFYGEVLDWLTAITPGEKHKALTVASSKNPRGEDSPVASTDKSERVVPSLVIRFNEGVTKVLKIAGYKVKVQVVVPEGKDKMSSQYEYSKIEFTMNSYEAQQAVIAQLEKLNIEKGTTRKAVLKMVTQWGDWTTRSDLPPRTMESVSLLDDQKKRIVNDLANFLECEDKYNRLAIPWHRGYMFHGPPGTGKTSLVKALANRFNLDLWYISLSDLKAESSLINLLSMVGPRSLLLLEDIDTISITHDRESSEQGTISMSSLLNTLDGVATPHGLIAMMTTNHFDKLDPALTRAGRMDVVEKLDYPSIKTLEQLYKHFFGVRPHWGSYRDDDIPIEGLSTSQVAEVMKRHMDDPKQAAKEIRELIDAIILA